jgi:hypothetical protein
MSIVHSSRAVNPRDLQVTRLPSHAAAHALASALQAARIPCAIHTFPEFQGNWWAVCVDRKSQLALAVKLKEAFAAGYDAALTYAGRVL